MSRTLFALFITFSIMASIAAAEGTGTIYGGVYDSSGNPLIGATVVVTGTSYGAMTDANGTYTITGVQEGTYSIEARMVGLATATIMDVEVDAGRSTRVVFGSSIYGVPQLPSSTGTDTDLIQLTGDDDPHSGRFLATTDDGTVFDLPLEHTDVQIEVDGCMQMATVRQVFSNSAESPIEAVYTFPLPEDGAVNSMDMYLGDRRIKGLIYEREQAEQVYTEAIESGRTASMLSQERPNIFTQSVGNILPGDSITIQITYVAPLHIDECTYEIVFPTVVGPRFIPGGATGPSTGGWSPPTDAVPDADRITPPVIPEGMRSGYDIDISVQINAGIPIRHLECLNHEISLDIEESTARVDLISRNEIPNRDFVLRYDTGSEDIETALITHQDRRGDCFMLIVQPQVEVDTDRLTAKEIFFVVDCSGSMSGAPMAAAKETMRMFISGMNPNDTFQILKFSEQASSISQQPLANNTENVQRGLVFVEEMRGSGGTRMISGVRAAIGSPRDPDRLRYVIFLTDGYIGNEGEILREIRTTLGENIRFFSVGIGSSVNRYLIEGMAEEGRGQAFYIGVSEDPAEAVTTIYERINNPYILDFHIDWGDIEVFDVYPSGIYDIYPGETLFISGRYFGSGLNTIALEGMISLDEWEQEETVLLPYTDRDNESVAILWARKRIHELERRLLTAENEEQIIDEITSTALLYSIVSDYTSFVAVSDEVRIDSTGRPVTVQVPVNMPEGVSYEGVFGTGDSPQGPSGPQYHAVGGNTGLVPETVGNTTITVTDSRGLIMPDATASFHVVGREEVRTMAVAGISDCTRYDASETEVDISGLRPSVSREYIQNTLGLTEYQITLAVIAVKQDLEDIYSDILEDLEQVEGELTVPAGMITFEITFDEGGHATAVIAGMNGTNSDFLAEEVSDILMGMEIPPPPEGAGTVSITLLFELVVE